LIVEAPDALVWVGCATSQAIKAPIIRCANSPECKAGRTTRVLQ
jgi:hypothetical protein